MEKVLIKVSDSAQSIVEYIEFSDLCNHLITTFDQIEKFEIRKIFHFQTLRKSTTNYVHLQNFNKVRLSA